MDHYNKTQELAIAEARDLLIEIEKSMHDSSPLRDRTKLTIAKLTNVLEYIDVVSKRTNK